MSGQPPACLFVFEPGNGAVKLNRFLVSVVVVAPTLWVAPVFAQVSHGGAERGVPSARVGGPLQAPVQAGVKRRGTGTPVLPPVNPGDQGVPSPPVVSTPQEAPVPVTGRLGQVLADTDVYRLPDPRAQWVGRIKRSARIAVLGQGQGWYSVLMGDGSQAYAPQTHVELLPYEVKAVRPVRPPASGAAPVQPGGSGNMPRPGMAAGGPVVRAVIQTAFQYENTPYVYGGNTDRGIDCSGLVKNCFQAVGVKLPRRASEQALVGRSIPLSELQPGDRLYFSVKQTHDHTGIYLGDGYFIHASRSRGKVGVDHLSTRLYGENLTAARRL